MHTGEITIIYILHSAQTLKRPRLIQDILKKSKTLSAVLQKVTYEHENSEHKPSIFIESNFINP